MSEVVFELRNQENDIIVESKNFYEIKNALVQDIIDEMWNNDKEELINNVCDGVEIEGDYYSAYNIVDALGNVDNVVESILKGEFWNLHVPKIGEESTEVVDYGYTISCRALVEYEIVTIALSDGVITAVSEYPTNENEFNDRLVGYVKCGWSMFGNIYRTETKVKAHITKVFD